MDFESHGNINPKLINILNFIPENGKKTTWVEIKNLLTNKKLVNSLQFLEEETETFQTVYLIWVTEGIDNYYTIISDLENSSDITDFEANYKSDSNKNSQVKSEDGKIVVRAESRPIDTTTCFTGRGDSDNNVGDGKVFVWDFTNEDDLIDAPEGYKRKRIEFKFLDTVWIKEGTLYFHDMPKGSYADVYIVCPTGAYYPDNNGDYKQATEDTVIAHYVNHHIIEGTVPMGDELNTECCSSGIPNFYKFWIEVTIPEESGTNAHGNFEIEMYRARTRIL